MIFGLSAISDMSTGQLTDQIVLDQQAADAATALAAQQAATPTSSVLPLLLLVAAAGVGYWWFIMKGKSVSLPLSLTAFTG
jgi:hypothetical protein